MNVITMYWILVCVFIIAIIAGINMFYGKGNE